MIETAELRVEEMTDDEVVAKVQSLWHLGAMDTIDKLMGLCKTAWMGMGLNNLRATKKVQKCLSLGTLGVPSIHRSEWKKVEPDVGLYMGPRE